MSFPVVRYIFSSLTAVVIAASAFGQTSTKETSPKSAEELIAAVRQAQLPSEHVKIRWTRETVDPFYMFGARSTGKVYAIEDSNLLIRDGVRARFEQVREEFSDDEARNHVRTTYEKRVYDGSHFRSIRERPHDPSFVPRGDKSFADNTSYAMRELFGAVTDIHDAKFVSQCEFEMEDNPANGIYVLNYIEPDGIRTRLTIDSNKSFNVVRTERFFAHNRKGWEIEAKFTLLPGGRWYLKERTQTHWGIENDHSQIHDIVTVEGVDLDFQASDDMFSLSFPYMSRIWNDVYDRWFSAVPMP